uniref:Uncharacterized protein n=1 Tax=Anguilla anguilla TaxID=7936 RepID=A0A0E9RZ22_ANGAN
MSMRVHTETPQLTNPRYYQFSSPTVHPNKP